MRSPKFWSRTDSGVPQNAGSTGCAVALGISTTVIAVISPKTAVRKEARIAEV
jgi:hypothetical protein